jgi:hypothetical protein
MGEAQPAGNGSLAQPTRPTGFVADPVRAGSGAREPGRARWANVAGVPQPAAQRRADHATAAAENSRGRAGDRRRYVGGASAARRDTGSATRVHTGTKCALGPPAASLRAPRSGKPDSDARNESHARLGRALQQLRSQGSHGRGQGGPRAGPARGSGGRHTGQPGRTSVYRPRLQSARVLISRLRHRPTGFAGLACHHLASTCQEDGRLIGEAAGTDGWITVLVPPMGEIQRLVSLRRRINLLDQVRSENGR